MHIICIFSTAVNTDKFPLVHDYISQMLQDRERDRGSTAVKKIGLAPS